MFFGNDRSAKRSIDDSSQHDVMCENLPRWFEIYEWYPQHWNHRIQYSSMVSCLRFHVNVHLCINSQSNLRIFDTIWRKHFLCVDRGKFENSERFFNNLNYFFNHQKYKINIAIIVPPVMVLLAKSLMFDKYDLSSMKGKIILLKFYHEMKLWLT